MSVYSCANCFSQNGLGFFRFPAQSERRQRWIAAVNMNDWEPKNHSCGQRFVSDT